MSEGSRSIHTLKMVRDFLQKYDSLIEEMATFKDKYGYDFKDAMETLGSNDFLSLVVKDLPPEKLGYLLYVVNDISSMTGDFQNFITYDKNQMLDFRKNLKKTIDNLDKIVK